MAPVMAFAGATIEAALKTTQAAPYRPFALHLQSGGHANV